MEQNIYEKLKKKSFRINDSVINFVLSLIVPFLASMVLYIIFMFLATASGNSNAEFMKTPFVHVVSLIFTPLVFLFIYIIYCKKTRVNCFVASDISFKLNWLNILTVVLIAGVSVVLIAPFISLVDYSLTLIGYAPSNSLPLEMKNAGAFILGTIAMAILPAICEELLFRGIILKGFQSKLNPHAAIFLTAIMFTLLHGSLQQTVYQFILGVLLGYAMFFGKSIIYPMILHFVNNFIIVVNSFIYQVNNVELSSVVYRTGWDYVFPILLFIVAGLIVAGLVNILKDYKGIYNSGKKIVLVPTIIHFINAVSCAVVYLCCAPMVENPALTKNQITGLTYLPYILLIVISLGLMLGVFVWFTKLKGKNTNQQVQVLEQNDLETSNKSESLEVESNIIVSEVESTQNKLTKSEKIAILGSCAFALLLWISNTIMQFFNL